MNYPLLQRLSASALDALPEAFFRGAFCDVDDKYLSDFHRAISLDDLSTAIETCLAKFAEKREMTKNEWKGESEAWLAPRLHSSLRLTRAEAADSEIWNFLATAAFPEYVFWRWGQSGKVQRSKFIGSDTKHALKRLWWTAELARNGPDYSLCDVAFWNQDIPSTIFTLRAVHNPAVAIAILRFIRDREMKNSDEINALSTKLNSTAVTVSLDMIAPYPQAPDLNDSVWIDGSVHSLDEPEGPNDAAVSEEAVAEVTILLNELQK